jgi:hypothetical protein
MAKEYAVSMDVTMSCIVYVNAENEDDAKAIARNYVDDNPSYYAHNGAYVNCEVTDVE